MSAENAWKVAREAGAAEADRMAWEWRNTPPPRDGFAPVYEAAARKVATSLRSLPMPPAIRAEEERAELTRLRAENAALRDELASTGVTHDLALAAVKRERDKLREALEDIADGLGENEADIPKSGEMMRVVARAALQEKPHD